MQKNNAVTIKSNTPAPDRKQGGAVLIVCLVMLTILTIIGIGTTTDISFQSNMVRNSQLRLNAFNTALSELNGQFYKLESADAGAEDLLNEAEQNEGTQIPIVDLTQTSADNPFSQSVTIVSLGEVPGQASGNRIISGASGGPTFKFEIHSITGLDNTGVGSNQTSGIERLKPITPE